MYFRWFSNLVIINQSEASIANFSQSEAASPVPHGVGQTPDEVVPPDGVTEILRQAGDLHRHVDQLDEHGEGQPQQDVTHQAPAQAPALNKTQNFRLRQK